MKKKTRERAYNRDRAAKAVCHICGKPIDYSLPPKDPQAWAPDHIVAQSIDPNRIDDLSNIAASHKVCNMSRGNGLIKLYGRGGAKLEPGLRGNNSLLEKVNLRLHLLRLADIEAPSVLDAYCGSHGDVWRSIPHGYIVSLDKLKTSSAENFIHVTDNARWIRGNDLSQFDVIDLDAYGTPMKQLNAVVDNPTTKEDTIITATAYSANQLRAVQLEVGEYMCMPREAASLCRAALARWNVDVCLAQANDYARDHVVYTITRPTTRSGRVCYYGFFFKKN